MYSVPIWIFKLAFILCIVESTQKVQNENRLICAKNIGTKVRIYEEAPEKQESSTNSTFQTCSKEYTNCYTLWQEDPENGTKTVMAQGCWMKDCESVECVATKAPPKVRSDLKFCCCFGDLCNTNFTDRYKPEEPSNTPTFTGPEPSSISPIIWIVIVICFFVIVLCCCLVAYFYWGFRNKKIDVEIGKHIVTSPTNLDKLKLSSLIGQGRYGSVWQGTVDDTEVAVKVFPAHHRNYFINEYEVYQAAGEHSSLLKCYGGGEQSAAPGGPTDYLLILSLENECLQEYLKKHTIDLGVFTKMSLGISRGLAYLHSDFGKLCIAHRDINTRNILVRSDLSSVICDLGLAVIPRKTENRSLSEAGTLRYMAPEVLEGAVNLRDCESALKQIDVYSLGLVIWELGTRCTDVQDLEPETYAPPFCKEAGDNPTLEQMQTLVSHRKARPLWPASWKETPAAQLILETAEDCWDQDPEARLMAPCVQERLMELHSLKGQTQTLHRISHSVPSPTRFVNNNHLHDNTDDASSDTMETLLSPSTENYKNSNSLPVYVRPMQPYQDRNSCSERNVF